MRQVVAKPLRMACSRWPHAMYALAGIAARVTIWAGRGSPEEWMRSHLPELTPERAAKARAENWAATLRFHVLVRAMSVEGGPSPFPRLVGGPDPASLRPPLILVTLHVGTPGALGGFLERLPGEVYAIQHGDWPENPSLPMPPFGHGQGHRAAIYGRALKTLRAGGFVFGAVDGDGAPVDVHILGRPRRIARGLLAAARATGAPLLPIASRWRSNGIEVVAGEPIEPAGDEAMAGELVKWFDDFVRENPAALQPY